MRSSQLRTPRAVAVERRLRKQRAQQLANLVSDYLHENEDYLRPDEQHLFQRFIILLRRLGW